MIYGYNYLSYFNLIESSTRHCIFFLEMHFGTYIIVVSYLVYTHRKHQFLSYQFINLIILNGRTTKHE